MKVYDCAQRSDEWRQLRVGMFTASCASDMMATIKTGEAAARRDLRVRLTVERLTNTSQENGFVSADMQRGTDKEPEALAAYEALTDTLVRPVGFIAHDILRAGCSPDGVIGDFTGILELKCPKSATHLSYLKAKTVPKEYTYQLLHTLWITGAQWVDFVSFDDRFPVGLQLFHVRLTRNQTEIDSYALLAQGFLGEIDRELDALRAMETVAV